MCIALHECNIIINVTLCTLSFVVKKIDHCCACDSVKPWEIGQIPTNSMLVEYLIPGGTMTSLCPLPNYNSSLPSIVEHTNERLKSLPGNMCSFTEIVKLVLSNNVIDEISNISCLRNVEIIDLSHNKINRIYNTTFNDLPLLRKLDLSHNEIKTIDTNSFQGKGRTISSINLSSCKLTEYDVSNFIFNNTFCEVNLDENSLTEITNNADFKVAKNSIYGNDGTISMHQSNLLTFFNFTDLGFEPLEIHKYLFISFKMEGLNIACDCLLFQLYERNFDFISRTWFRKNNTCTRPEYLKGLMAKDLVNNYTLRDNMVCDVKENCPKKCSCYDQPRFNHLVINCSNARLTEFPHKVPWHGNYTLLLDGNNIQSVPNSDYLSRVSVVNLTNNDISHISSDALDSLQEGVKVDLTNNKNLQISKKLASKVGSGLVIGNYITICDCKTSWMSDWKTYQSDANNIRIECSNYDGKDLLQIQQKLKEACYVANIVYVYVLCVIGFLVCAMTCIYMKFRPEVLVLYATFFR